MPKLTKRTIDAAHPNPDRDVFVWDDELPAYGLRVKPSGSKAFILQYRNRSKPPPDHRTVWHHYP